MKKKKNKYNYKMTYFMITMNKNQDNLEFTLINKNSNNKINNILMMKKIKTILNIKIIKMKINKISKNQPHQKFLEQMK